MTAPMLGCNRLAIGGCGSGKTYALKSMLQDTLRQTHWRAIVLDLNNEWPGAKSTASYKLARSADGARRILEGGGRLAIIRPDDAQAKEHAAPWGDLGDELAQVAIDAPGHVCLVLPECHLVAREGYPLPKRLGTIVHRYRHSKTAFWGDTQHFRDVSKELVNEAHTLYFFAQGNPRDFEAISKYGARYGRELEDAVRKCGELAHHGRPGYFVRVTPLAARPPFTPERL